MSSDTDRKPTGVVGADEVNASSHSTSQQNLSDPDLAYQFLANANASDDAAGQVNLKSLRRKIDWHIVPILMLCYTMQFIDKVSLNVSRTAALLF